MRLFHPLKFMLATPAEKPADLVTEAQYRGETHVYIEDKYDGVRAQLHSEGDRVEIYSRTLDPVTHRFPEVVERACSPCPRCHVRRRDRGLFARRTGAACPSPPCKSAWAARPSRPSSCWQVPVACMVFDLLYLDGEVLLDAAPVSRARSCLPPSICPIPLGEGAHRACARRRSGADVEDEPAPAGRYCSTAARERGNEG